MDPKLVDLLASIGELLANLSDLTAEQLANLTDQLAEALDALSSAPATDAIVASAGTLADAAEQVAAERTRREGLVASAADLAARARGALRRPTPVPIARVVASAAGHRNPERERPSEGGTGALVASLTAGGDPAAQVRGLDDLAELFDRQVRAARSMKAGSDGERVIVASARWEYPADHDLRHARNDSQKASDVIEAAVQPMVASGGICRPVNVDYNIPTWANLERPVRDSLPSFQATRGGLHFIAGQPFDMSVFGPAVGIWTNANDITPGGANTGPGGVGVGPTVKPCIEMNCGTEMEVLVEAITQCVTIGNMRARFAPEQLRQALTYVGQAWAVTAEVELLRQMRAFAKHVSGTQLFGYARDSLVTLALINAYFRDKYRLSQNTMLRVVLKAWVKDAVRADLTKAAFPYEGGVGYNSLSVPDAAINQWFADRNMVVTWALDSDIADQNFTNLAPGTVAVPTPLMGFPAITRMLIYPEGTYQFLDGGQLDLGVTRDSTLNAVNKFQIFSESFEGVAPRGFEALDLSCAFKVNGAAAGTVAPS